MGFVTDCLCLHCDGDEYVVNGVALSINKLVNNSNNIVLFVGIIVVVAGIMIYDCVVQVGVSLYSYWFSACCCLSYVCSTAFNKIVSGRFVC